MIPVPNLDDRTHRDIVEEALRLIPQYCPEWTNFNPSDPGVTLVELFAWMTEMVIYRLNKVTDKNFIAFLNMMGVRLQPPQPARALLQLKLVPGAPATWVKAGTPVSTVQSGRDEPVVFETTEDLLVTDNQLMRAFTQVSDEYSDQTPFLDGRTPEGFEVFSGVNHIERSLYLADPRFEQVGEDSLLVVRISSAGSAAIVDLLEWEYWNGRRWREMTRSLTQVEEDAVAFEDIDAIHELEINGIDGRWIRGRLIETPEDPQDTVVDAVHCRVELTGEGLAPTGAYVNIDSGVFLTVDLQRAWAPFGNEPRTEHVLYLLPQALPTQPGSVVRIDVLLADAKLYDPPQPSEDLSLVWEYHDGKKWRLLGFATPEGSRSAPSIDFVDGTAGFTQSGEVRFRRPEKLGEVEIQNEPGPWLRCRIERGDYGVAGQYELDGDRWIWRDERPLRPPWVRGMTFRYTEEDQPVTHVLTYNDFAYFDHSSTARTPLKVFQAFEASSEDSPTLYMGFAKAFPNAPSRVFFQTNEKTSLERDRGHAEYLQAYYEARDRALEAEQRVVWEYWNGTDWVDLAPRDGTRAFTESGFLSFVGPADHKPSKKFGEALYWMRARLEMGGYHQTPRVTHVLLNATWAHNQTTISGEVLGNSDGTPNQAFRFAQGPLLEGQSILVRERDVPAGDERAALEAQGGEDAVRPLPEGGCWVRWREVESFFESGPRGRHYVVDRVRGEVRFGDGRKGMPPPAGTANVVAEFYRIGGGARGNVTADVVTAMRKSIAHIESVTNPFPAAGGSDQETVDEAKARGPHVIKSRNRAVTAEDFEWLTLQASNGIARAKCLNTIGREGEVTVVVVPKQDEKRLDLTMKLVPSTELLRRVRHFLDERRLLTTIVRVVRPRYVEISIGVEVVRTTSGSSDAVRRAVEDKLRRFLHPLVGGRSGGGWDFGRNVLKLDLYHVVEEVDGVDAVHRIRLIDEDRRAEVEQLKVRADELVHLCDVDVIEKPREKFL
ncbi:MAG: putative baseplate assembly protein [Myxococcales bacterium]|nr:putative baseplate assembly protein [Myxococcales bacterium]MCB9534895.1 putative baseplate assembly protein [Myxococcales bacterium]